MKKLFLTLLVIAIAAGGYYTYRQHAAGSQSAGGGAGMMMGGPVGVNTVTVMPKAVTFTRELPGRTTAYRVAEIRPQVSGIVLKRLFTEGSEVEAGQQLYQIDPATYEAAYNSAKADLMKAQANVKSVEAKAARYAELVKISAVSKQDYDDIVAELAQDKAAVAVAQAAVDTAKINLDYTHVNSPIAGHIGKSAVTEGALVTANQTTPLATVQQLDPIYVDLTQSSSEVLKLRQELQAPGSSVKPDNTAPVTLVLESTGQTYPQKGTLQFADVTVDESTGAVQMRALFPNPDRTLLPGLFVRARVEQASEPNALMVPQKAVVRNADGSASVWVVDKDSKAQSHTVTLGDTQGDEWLVKDGLTAGDRVIVDGIQKVQPGTPVTASDAQATAPAQGAAPAAAPAKPDTAPTAHDGAAHDSTTHDNAAAPAATDDDKKQ